ncbi:MAG TPA: right-handed parallel beta-helix repeat-containing protein [Thermoanaerobaculia bacterium]|nr:right-handed parallel beta-helix repeat-containing protein [Thermoanaerobaculia bacterium]
MRIHRVLGIFVLALGISVIANAQASRTWVSGVGDDANPCSRTAPCKTFAGAISKTAAGGEISVLDPGGFGAVTITKSITIEGADFVASILVSGVNGIVISAASTDHVYLRNLTFNGIGSGTNGIRILTAGRVTIENCTIFDFANSAVDIAPNGTATKVAISNTTLRNNNGFGVHSAPTSGGSVLLSLDNVRITGTTGNGVTGNGSAVFADSTSADVVNCVLSENATAGLFVRNSSEVNVHGTAMFRNGVGISVGDAGGGTVRLFGSSVVTNSNGIAIISGSVLTHGNNAIAGNGGTQATSSNISTQ